MQLQEMQRSFLKFNMAKKERLDKILVDLGYFETKSKASSAILAGNVMIGTEVITKAGYQLDPNKEYDFQVKSIIWRSFNGNEPRGFSSCIR